MDPKTRGPAGVASCRNHDRTTSVTETWEGGGSSPFGLASTIIESMRLVEGMCARVSVSVHEPR
jgi:hypothetical protein